MAMRIFLANLEKLLMHNGWKTEDMCAHLDFGISTLHACKTGKSKSTFTMLEQIARHANITVAELLCENFTPGIEKRDRVALLLAQCRKIYESFRILHSHMLIDFLDTLVVIAAMKKRI